LAGQPQSNAPESAVILVDTSVWIDFFRPTPGRAGFELRRMIDESEPFALAGMVVAEILQGIKRDLQSIERFLSQWQLLEPNGFPTYREAAAISRLAASQGISLKTVDTLIAAIAIENHATLFSMGKDFSRIARITSLRLYPFSAPAR
jgi:predicted nucleic acid-binding protein